MNKLILIAGGSTLVYAVLAAVMGVLPGIELSRAPPGPGVNPLTALQAEGRAVYVASGCSYCHTQQVRPLQQDKVFGRPSAPGDFAYQTPELLGSERTGPDLTNVGACCFIRARPTGATPSTTFFVTIAEKRCRCGQAACSCLFG